MRKKRYLNRAFVSLAALLLTLPSLLALPIITKVVETGGDNEATDTVVAHFTGEAFSNGIAGEFQDPFTIPVFGEDVPAYVDRTHQWNGATTDLPLPAYLVGGEYIMSGNDNRDNADYKLTITLSSPALVYLLIDNRLQDGNAVDPPTFGPDNMAWVEAQGWQPVLNGLNRTADNLVPDEVGVDEGGNGTGPGGDIQNWSSVYIKQFPAGDFEILQPDNAGRNMYGVVVTRLSDSAENPPKISNLTPANNTLFFGPAGGIHFTATTVSPNSIAATNIATQSEWHKRKRAARHYWHRYLSHGGVYQPRRQHSLQRANSRFRPDRAYHHEHIQLRYFYRSVSYHN